MRTSASVLHLDLDAFFASVEQRDKPSLRGRPVIVGGVGGRGVVATASYEARVFGVRSAMPTSEARRLAPHAAYLSGRFDAYRQSSHIVMELLRTLSPVVEQLSIDEAFVDLAGAGVDTTSAVALADLGQWIRAEVVRLTGGLTASVGIGSSKFIAKVASELAKPDGLRVVEPGTERATIAPLPARAIPGIGPATMDKLARLGVRTVDDLAELSVGELTREVGSWGPTLHDLARGIDERAVVPERETKSISVEDTFETDLTDRRALDAVATRDAAVVAGRVVRAGLFARTISIKVRTADFVTWTRSRTLSGGTDSAERIARVAGDLLDAVDLSRGVRLLGVGVSNFVIAAQEELFDAGGDDAEVTGGPVGVEESPQVVRRPVTGWLPGQDVEHDTWGRGWVWGSGHGRVTVRFETRVTGIGPVRSFAGDDPALRRPEALPDLPGSASPEVDERVDRE